MALGCVYLSQHVQVIIALSTTVATIIVKMQQDSSLLKCVLLLRLPQLMLT